jgi:hypothetical protein
MVYAGLIAVIVGAGLVLSIVFMYIGSVMRFILFDSIVARECHIRQGWRFRQDQGWRYFLWKVLYTLVVFGSIVVLIGIPAAFAFAAGWFKSPQEHMVGLVLAGVGLFLLLMIVLLAMTLIYVLVKDFVIPQMALEGIGVMEGWRRLWAMIQAEKSGYAGYVGMKIVLSIGAAILIGIASFIAALVILIPVVGVVIAAVVAGKSAGLDWNTSTITLAVVAGSVLLVVFMYLMALISVPAIVFFPAYSIYFFAPRYPRLSALLYPMPPIPPAGSPPPTEPPPTEPPPFPPAPQPAG